MSAEKPELRESHLRSIIKGLTWRCLAATVTFLLARWITGETVLAAKIAGWETVAKIFVYYMHERAWQQIPRGTVRRWWHKGKPTE